MDIEYSESYASKYSPIPLTPEILQKAGFIKENNTSGDCWRHGYFQIDSDLMAFVEVPDDRFRLYYSNQLNFLHQLQNLYSATHNVELVINL